MKRIICLVLSLCWAVVFAQEAPKEVTLVVSADGATKTEAINNALRAAVEQIYGTFVSANTEILNDELVKDEIATVSSGNIQKYKEIAVVTLPNGNTSVTLNVTVSLKKLVKYAQSKGSECEFAGATFGANARLYEFNKRNEQRAIENLIKQLDALRPIYDYQIDVSEPTTSDDGKTGTIGIQVTVKTGEKTKEFNEIIENTLMSLGMTEKEIKPLKEAGFSFTKYVLWIGKPNGINSKTIFYFYTSSIENLDRLLNNALNDFSITDNLGNEFMLIDFPYQRNNLSFGHRVSNDFREPFRFNYKLFENHCLNTHNGHINMYGMPTVNGIFTINRESTVWIFPKLYFIVPMEKINGISKINIKPSCKESTSITLYDNLKDRSKVAKLEYSRGDRWSSSGSQNAYWKGKSPYFTFYNYKGAIGAEIINELKTYRQTETSSESPDNDRNRRH